MRPIRDIPNWIRLRYEAGETLTQLAEESGISSKTLQRRAKKMKWERKRGSSPKKNAPRLLEPQSEEEEKQQKEQERIQREMDQARFLIEEARTQAPGEYLALVRHLKARVARWLEVNPIDGRTSLQALAQATQITIMLASLEDKITGFLFVPVVQQQPEIVIKIVREVSGDIIGIDTSDPADGIWESVEGAEEPPEPTN